jgi:hypothetical protein
MMRRLAEVLIAGVCSALLVIVTGCEHSDRGSVSGAVTLDGQPVDGGIISFFPNGREARKSACTTIAAGRYAVPAGSGPAIGANRVEIRWSRKTGKKVPGALLASRETDELVEAVPARYNANSELKVEIKPGDNQADFQLKSK